MTENASLPRDRIAFGILDLDGHLLGEDCVTWLENLLEKEQRITVFMIRGKRQKYAIMYVAANVYAVPIVKFARRVEVCR